MTKPYHREYWSKERLLAIVCFVVGTSTWALFTFGERSDPIIPLMLLGLGVFWWTGGLTGHGTL